MKIISRNKKKKSGGIFTVLTLFFARIFGFSAWKLISYYSQSAEEEKVFEKLKDPKASPAEKYAELYRQNPDFTGWLFVENTGIDYPVMHTPDNPEYYLRRTFDGSYAVSGTPFIGGNCTIDSDMFVIFGHNMKSDTMFGGLDKYSEQTFWRDNPKFTFSTLTEERTYEIFAVVKTRLLYQGEEGYNCYDHAGDLDEPSYNELVQWFEDNSLYDTMVDPVYGEQILLLSTCSYHHENGRFIVAARLVDAQEY